MSATLNFWAGAAMAVIVEDIWEERKTRKVC